jgi:hypothetical protein
VSLPLTPHHLAACYEFVRALPPFSGYNLPHADTVEFTVNRHPNWCGAYLEGSNGKHEIAISIRCVGHTDTLVRIMSHEMLHLAQVLKGVAPKGDVMHNSDFRRRAERICRIHGWDERLYT